MMNASTINNDDEGLDRGERVKVVSLSSLIDGTDQQKQPIIRAVKDFCLLNSKMAVRGSIIAGLILVNFINEDNPPGAAPPPFLDRAFIDSIFNYKFQNKQEKIRHDMVR